MADFTTSVDVANRALQHCGAQRIVLFTDNSKNAAEVDFCYDKLRKAELRRNVWRFAIRKAALRPVDTDTFFVTFAYDPLATYDVNAVVSYNNVTYYSRYDSNLGSQPDISPVAWSRYFGPTTATLYDSTVTYFAGELVYDSTVPTPVVYLSLLNGNDDIPPSANWRILGGAVLTPPNFIYPVGSGPSSQQGTRNVFVLPNGFLREAPQSPRTGSHSVSGGPSALPYTDWEYEGNFFVSSDVDPIIYRFVADIADVMMMDAMFCEALGARIGLEVCETLTQSSEKKSSIGAEYNRFMGEARAINGIETGPTEPPEDEFIACRL